jgi:hypothetical protein
MAVNVGTYSNMVTHRYQDDVSAILAPLNPEPQATLAQRMWPRCTAYLFLYRLYLDIILFQYVAEPATTRAARLQDKLAQVTSARAMALHLVRGLRLHTASGSAARDAVEGVIVTFYTRMLNLESEFHNIRVNLVSTGGNDRHGHETANGTA